MVKSIKKVFVISLLVLGSLTLISCTKNVESKEKAVNEVQEIKETVENDENKENIKFVKEFYEKYLSEVEKTEVDEQKLDEIVKQYVGDLMALEMYFRSRHSDANMYVMSQDPTGMKKLLKVEKGDQDGWVNVSLNSKDEFGEVQRIIKIHITNKNGKKVIDTINNYEKRIDKNGNVEDQYSRITKFGNKELNDEVQKQIDEEIAYFKKCDEEGFIS